jgi:Immunoglobulin I-set domain
VTWYKNTLRLDTTERIYSESRGSRHTLFIRKVVAEDFKNYSCVADNGLGKMRQYLELSGTYKLSSRPCISFPHIVPRVENTHTLARGKRIPSPVATSGARPD